MDVTMQTKLVAGRNNLLRHFGIPLYNFANQINTRFGITQLLKDRVKSIQRESAIQVTPINGIGQAIIVPEQRKHWFIIYT
jgi:hypothetical protein